jgi:hypothetical protein
MRSKPKDFGQSVINRLHVAPAERVVLALGQWTANTADVVAPARFIADRRLRIEEIWFAVSAIPVDADGLVSIYVKNFDISEGAEDTIVASFDGETVFVAADKGYKATLAAETSEFEHVLEPGDVLKFYFTSDSAAIDTNADVSAIIVFKTLEDVIR